MRKPINVAVRLNPQKHRRLREGVVKQGTSIQSVLEGLIDQWIEERERGGDQPADLRGYLRDGDLLELRRREREAELKRERSRL